MMDSLTGGPTPGIRDDVIVHLTAALDAETCAEKDYHVRQALQLIAIHDP